MKFTTKIPQRENVDKDKESIISFVFLVLSCAGGCDRCSIGEEDGLCPPLRRDRSVRQLSTRYTR